MTPFEATVADLYQRLRTKREPAPTEHEIRALLAMRNDAFATAMVDLLLGLLPPLGMSMG